MLKTLPKYVLREHLGPFIFALIVIDSVFILNLVFRQLGKFLSKGIQFDVIVEFLFLNLAWMVALSVPMAVLSATIMAFGRLSAEHEITALKASGVSLSKIVLHVLAAGFLLCFGLIWFNNHVLPDFNHRARMLAVDIARKKPMINLNAGVLYTDIPDYSILAQRVAERNDISYVDSIVIDDQSNQNTVKTIVANRAELFMDEKTGLLEVTLFEGQAHELDITKPESLKKIDFPKHIIRIPMDASLLRRTESGYRGDREKSASALMEGVMQSRKRIEERQQKITEIVRKKFQQYVFEEDANRSLDAAIRDHKQLLRQIRSELNMIKSYDRSSKVYLVEYHKKYSIPAACVVFILIGAPLGILIRRSGWPMAAGISLAFFLLYWAFLIGGEILADRQLISPFFAMWNPNFLVGGIGILLVIYTIRETRFFR